MHEITKETHAIKVIARNENIGKAAECDFMREVRVMQFLRHKHIVALEEVN